MSVDDDVLKEVLEKHVTVAVVGCSRNPTKAAYRVPAYLKFKGFRIIPVNPFADEILGERAYKSLLDIPPELAKHVGIIDVFRPSEEVPDIVEQAIQLKVRHGNPRVIWMQSGIVNEQAAEKAREAGMIVVTDRCIKVEHFRLMRHRPCLKGE